MEHAGTEVPLPRPSPSCSGCRDFIYWEFECWWSSIVRLLSATAVSKHPVSLRALESHRLQAGHSSSPLRPYIKIKFPRATQSTIVALHALLLILLMFCHAVASTACRARPTRQVLRSNDAGHRKRTSLPHLEWADFKPSDVLPPAYIHRHHSIVRMYRSSTLAKVEGAYTAQNTMTS